MKAILMSIRPKYVADILNGKKTIEIRKTMPKCDLPIDVYIYCTKGEQVYSHLIPIEFNDNSKIGNVVGYKWKTEILKDTSCLWEEEPPLPLNGKVVAKFTLNFGEEWEVCPQKEPDEEDKKVIDNICLTKEEIIKYANGKHIFGWYISDLIIFDKPKDISEFWNNGKKVKGHKGTYQYSKLTNAPQSWCYVEI